MTAYWCELAWLGGERAEAGVVVEIEGERIESVEPMVTEPPPAAEVLRGLTLPGFCNAHSHAFHRALRGRSQGERGSFWTWREQMYVLADRLDPDRYRALATAVFAEMALAGITAVGEFHYVHHGPDGAPYGDPNEMGRALVQAAAEAGIRITLLDTCYLQAGDGRAPEGAQRRFADHDADAWAERVEPLSDLGEHARPGAAIHSVRAVDPASCATVASWATERAVPLHAHVSEQPAENEAIEAAHGLSPTGVLAEAGALTERFSAVHFTHTSPADVAALGSSEATACLCPTTERDLADGVGAARAFASAGASLALGSDSHAVIDHFSEMRAMEVDQRLVTGERGLHTSAELLQAATSSGHRSIGWPEAGSIAPGGLADLVTVSLDGVRLAGVDSESALDATVFAATAADVRNVVAGGREVVRDGVHLTIDVATELRETIAGVWT
jgi:formiminoglutamate deiminase